MYTITGGNLLTTLFSHLTLHFTTELSTGSGSVDDLSSVTGVQRSHYLHCAVARASLTATDPGEYGNHTVALYLEDAAVTLRVPDGRLGPATDVVGLDLLPRKLSGYVCSLSVIPEFQDLSGVRQVDATGVKGRGKAACGHRLAGMAAWCDKAILVDYCCHKIDYQDHRLGVENDKICHSRGP